MDINNQFINCINQLEEDKKSHCLEKLAHQIEIKKINIDNTFWQIMIDEIKKETSEYIIYRLWLVTIKSGKNEIFKNFITNFILTNNYPRKDYAITYLRIYYPDFKEDLINIFKNSTNANELLALSQIYDENESDKKMNILLNIFDNIDPFDHQLFEEIDYIFMMNAKEEHLKYYEEKVKNNPELITRYQYPIDLLKAKFDNKLRL